MNLEQIRIKTAYTEAIKINSKSATRTWLLQLCKNYPIALTLTLKQTMLIKCDKGTYLKKLTRSDCDTIAESFAKKLNKVVFKNAAIRYGKKLNYLVVVEGERSCKKLHIHIALGNLPTHIRFNEVNDLVKKAKKLVGELDEQHKVAIADSGWTDYITKEVSKADTSNVLWHLA